MNRLVKAYEGFVRNPLTRKKEVNSHIFPHTGKNVRIELKSSFMALFSSAHEDEEPLKGKSLIGSLYKKRFICDKRKKF